MAVALNLPDQGVGPRLYNGHRPLPDGICSCGFNHRRDLDTWQAHYAEAMVAAGRI